MGIESLPLAEKDIHPDHAEMAGKDHGRQKGGYGSGDDVFKGMCEFRSNSNTLLKQVVFLVNMLVYEA